MFLKYMYENFERNNSIKDTEKPEEFLAENCNH